MEHAEFGSMCFGDVVVIEGPESWVYGMREVVYDPDGDDLRLGPSVERRAE